MHQLSTLILLNGSHYRMEKPQTTDERYEENDCENILDLVETVCDVKGHLFLDGYSEYDVDGEFDGNLYAKCIVCENLIKFWYYSPEMVDVIKSKVMCC